MPATIADVLSQTTLQLADVTETPRLEAEMLLAHAMNMSRASLLARLREPVEAPRFGELLRRRLGHEPLSYIFGEWEFFGLSMLVRPPLLTPRPETEHLVETALAFLAGKEHAQTVADVCCGTGCVAVAIAHHAPAHRVYALDIRRDALETTRSNAARHHTAVECVQSDLLTCFTAVQPAFDLIVANPPYVPENEWADLSPVITRYEDPGALLAGADGLEIIRRLIPQARQCLCKGGVLAMEIGENQFDAVKRLMDKNGFGSLEAVRDLAGIQRVISGVRDGE